MSDVDEEMTCEGHEYAEPKAVEHIAREIICQKTYSKEGNEFFIDPKGKCLMCQSAIRFHYHMLYVVLQCMNDNIGFHKEKRVGENNPFVSLFEGLDSEYLISLNIGAIWNVITLWIHKGMREDPEHIKNSIRQYLKRVSAGR